VETFKIILVVGLLAGAVAVGLAYVASLFGGSAVSGDEIVRNVVLGFIVAAIAVLTVRRRLKN